MKQVIPFVSREYWLAQRHQDVTSTEVSALFGCNKYLTKWQLYQNKTSGETITFEESERMKWGTRLQEAIGYGVAKDLGIEVKPLTDYIRDIEYRIGSSFDFKISDSEIMEIKNVDSLVFKTEWVNESKLIEPPLHIQFQVQHQMLVGGFKKCKLVALVGGNSAKVLDVEYSPAVGTAIKKTVKKFWEDVNTLKEPAIDWERDSMSVIESLQTVTPGKLIEASNEISLLAAQYLETCEQEKVIEKKKTEIKAKLLEQIGDADKVISPAFIISAGPVKESEYTVKRKGYRGFRVTPK